MGDRLFHGSLKASIVDVVDAGVDLLPHFELAAIPLVNGIERPAEWPEIRRRLLAEGIRAERHRGVILLEPAGRLEAVLQEHEGKSVRLAAVVCHPHPLYGGTLHNKVVHRAAATLHALGAAVLRFNFRGAGKSDGWFDGGAGELEDARA